MVTRVHVQKAERLIADGRVDHLVNSGKGEWILWIGLVEVHVIDAHSPLPILLLDQIGIGQPIRVLDLLDEARGQDFSELLANRLLLLSEAAEVRLHRLGIGLDVEVVLINLVGDPKHIRGLPYKHIGVVA